MTFKKIEMLKYEKIELVGISNILMLTNTKDKSFKTIYNFLISISFLWSTKFANIINRKDIDNGK